jgi:hypothetical protein
MNYKLVVKISFVLIATGIAGSAAYYYFTDEGPIESDTQSLDMLGWGDSESDLKARYTGAGTAVAELGYRDIGKVSGCNGADSEAIARRERKFSSPDIGIALCEVRVSSLREASGNDSPACMSAINTAVARWQSDWDATSDSEPPYEFRDVYPAGNSGGDGVIDIYDQVHTIEQLAGWPIGDTVPGYENSPTVWNGDYLGWSPAANKDSCPIAWAQCFDQKAALYKGISGLEALGESEGQCIIALSPDLNYGSGLYAVIDLIQEIAPDTGVVVASFGKNREDSMSRAADWLIENQSRFNIVAARTSNVVLLETTLLKPGQKELCGTDGWCKRISYEPYQSACSGNPYEGGKAFAYKSVAQLPDKYKPIAYQYERMRDAGIIAVKGAGHEGWKAALPYPDCSPALLSVGVVYTGAMPAAGERGATIERGWVSQGWRWHPDYYCEENSIQRDQISCATNNAPGLGYELSTGEIASPLMSVHPKESLGGNLGNAFVTPYVIGAIAVLKSSNLLPNMNATETLDVIHSGGVAVWDRRRCDQDPQTPEPDGWMRIGLDFFELKLASPVTNTGARLSEREVQLLDHPWVYNCTDATSPDTAPYHTDNVPDYSNQRLHIGNAVRRAITLNE